METKSKKACLFCANEAKQGIHCPRCKASIDMIIIIQNYAGSPAVCKQLMESLIANNITTCKQLEQRGEQIGAPKLIALSRYLRQIEVNNGGVSMLAKVVDKLSRPRPELTPSEMLEMLTMI